MTHAIEYPPADWAPAEPEPKPHLSLVPGLVEIEPVAEPAYEPLTVEQAYKLGVYDGIHGQVRNAAAVTLGYQPYPTKIYTAKTRW